MGGWRCEMALLTYLGFGPCLLVPFLVTRWSSLGFLMWQCDMCVKSLQLCPTLCDPMYYSLPGSSVHGILQARILEWVAMPSSTGSSSPRDPICVSCISHIGRQILYHWATREILIWRQEHSKKSKVEASGSFWLGFRTHRVSLPPNFTGQTKTQANPD